VGHCRVMQCPNRVKRYFEFFTKLTEPWEYLGIISRLGHYDYLGMISAKTNVIEVCMKSRVWKKRSRLIGIMRFLCEASNNNNCSWGPTLCCLPSTIFIFFVEQLFVYIFPCLDNEERAFWCSKCYDSLPYIVWHSLQL